MKTKEILKTIINNRSNLLATFLVLIIGMLLIPIPPFLLDLAFVINFALAIAIILVTMYAKDPFEFSTFPTVLLLVTLGRLALEISATRAILLNGHAGNIIHSVGEFVIGGNFVVGVIIFLILFVVNFMVVTQGAGRVSEVAARFALDSMPGKQLAVDADLNAGLIDEETAKKRRKSISKEADFYATMDGGSKFVKGDAIASIIIALVNVLAGFVIGMMQLGMSAGESASLYTVLTVGEGLASQIPALIISVATGIIVTRADPDINLAEDVGAQLFGRPEVLAAAGLTMLLLAFGIRGAFIPFFIGAAAFSFWSYKKFSADDYVAEITGGEGPNQIDADEAIERKLEAKKQDNSPEGVIKLLKVDQLEIELGYKLVHLIDPDKEGDLMERLGQIRRQLMVNLGLPVPAVRVHDNLQLAPDCYQVKLKGVKIAKGSVQASKYLAVDTGLVDPSVDTPPGDVTKEPSYGLDAIWIDEVDREKAETAGYTVATASAVLATHFTEIISSYAHEILSRQDLVRMMEEVKQSNASIVEEVCPNLLAMGDLLQILRNLLKEQISIRDFAAILEICANYAKINKEPEFLSERVRQGLGRQICSTLLTDGVLQSITFHPSIEEDLVNSLHLDRLALEPEKVKLILDNLKDACEELTRQGCPPVLLCNSKVRLALRKVVERVLPHLSVLGYNEVPSDLEAKSSAMVSYEGGSLAQIASAEPERSAEMEEIIADAVAEGLDEAELTGVAE